MATLNSSYAPAFTHDSIKKIYDNVYLVRGSIKMGPAMRMNRNMIIINNTGELSLINPVRLDDKTLQVLDGLGEVKRIMRLGDFHGLDDPFYLNRYQCDFWAQNNQTSYTEPTPNKIISSTTKSPVQNSSFFLFKTAKYPEAALLLHDYKLLITTDSIQFHDDWRYFSWLTKLAFKLLGFKLGINIGPPWLKRVTPKHESLKDDFEELMELDFNALIAAHGNLLPSNCKDKLRSELDRVSK